MTALPISHIAPGSPRWVYVVAVAAICQQPMRTLFWLLKVHFMRRRIAVAV